MVFSGLIFLYAFLPCVLLLYFLVPKCLKNTVLLLFSLFFYAWGEPRYLPIILLSIAQGWIAGLLIGKYSDRPKIKKVVLVSSLVLSLGILGCFKYADFLFTTINQVFRAEIPLWKLVLPVGISFYTFQILSYVVDVYRGDADVQKNPISFGTYVVLFPQLIAGPIVRYRDIALQLDDRKTTVEAAYDGAVRFLIGLGKKVLLANTLGTLVAAYRKSADPTVLYAWISALAYFFQIFFDFSGYSDMAIGLGKIFGFTFPENFRYPYTAVSITDFWRRWHMSLGTWFRDYVYIPLGGNRVSRGKWVRNILVVWGLTGFWHGAGWNFMLWGLFFGLLLLAEKLWYGDFMNRNRWIGHIYVLAVVIFSFVLFGAENMAQLTGDLKAMFGLSGLPLWNVESVYMLRSAFLLMVLACLGSTPLPAAVYHKLEGTRLAPVLSVVQPMGLVLLLLLCTAFLVDGSFNPFLYFRF